MRLFGIGPSRSASTTNATPRGVFGNRPSTYRVTENGYLFYSFGINGKDDGGRWYDDEPQGDDIRVLKPLPALRPRE